MVKFIKFLHDGFVDCHFVCCIWMIQLILACTAHEHLIRTREDTKGSEHWLV